MKRLPLLILIPFIFIAFTQCNNQKQNGQLILSGFVENPNSDHVIFSEDIFIDPILFDTAWLDENGNFSLTFELKECTPVQLFDGNEVAHLYLCPGDSLHITLNAEAFDETLHFEGRGEERNNLLAEYYLKFLDWGNIDRTNFYSIRDTSLNIFIELLNEDNEILRSFLEKFKEKNALNEEFISFMDTRIYFDKLSNMYSLLSAHPGDTTPEKIEKREMVMKNIKAGINYKNPNKQSSEYIVWATYYLPNVMRRELFKEMPEASRTELDSVLMLQMRDELPASVFSLYFDRVVNAYAESHMPNELQNLRIWAVNNYNDQKVIDNIDQKYEKVMADLSQKLPDDSFLFDLDDEELKDLSFDDVLAKYRGTVIYLDFWASWCSPCKDEMPNSAALAKKLKDEDVTFLYVSTDKNAEAWVDMIKIMQLHGIHYRLGNNIRDTVFTTYDVQYIPHYVLFDKEGNMVKNRMYRPGVAETEEMIMELL
jgi:thiol-disulfide isomerase/thioredoxin